MPRRQPLTWFFCTALALLLTVFGFLLIPRSWIFLLPDPTAASERLRSGPAGRWIQILPPPDIQVVERLPRAKPPPLRPQLPAPPPEDPRWWTQGWQVRTRQAGQQALTPAAAADSVQTLLDLLGAPPDLLQRARPDSTLAALLVLRRLEGTLAIDEVKPMLKAIGLAEDYKDLMSRVADMYDDFLAQQIIAPD